MFGEIQALNHCDVSVSFYSLFKSKFGVSEEDAVTVGALLLELSAMQFSQAARMRLFATSHYRNLTLGSMGLRHRLNVSAAVRIPRDGEYLFGGKLLDSIDTDISLHKRAKEVASRLAKPHCVRRLLERPRYYQEPSRVQGV